MKRSSVVKKMKGKIYEKLSLMFYKWCCSIKILLQCEFVQCRWISRQKVKKNTSSLLPFCSTVGCVSPCWQHTLFTATAEAIVGRGGQWWGGTIDGMCICVGRTSREKK
jgi:hypothetical protein